MDMKKFKKSFLTILIVASVLLLDLVATLFSALGLLDATWTDAAVGRFMRGLSQGTLVRALRGEEDPATSMPESIPATEAIESTEELIAETEILEELVPVKKEFVTVEDDYFADALFIGDSRVGMVYFWNGMPGMTYYYNTVYSI